MFSVIIFTIILYGNGRFFFNKKSNFIETAAVGLALIPVLGVILNIVRIPLDWRIFLGIALIAPCYQFIMWWKERRAIPELKLKCPSWQTAIILILIIFALFLYCWGTFQYPWLEDDDPWAHAAGIKYIAIEKNLNAPEGTFQYLNPYPPGYDLLFGILHQINPSIYWTLKFFNGLIIVMGFLFFYMFAKEFTQNKNKAVLALFFLIMIPCYLTHFIWAHSLVITLFFPAFNFLLKSFKDKKYILPATICCASIALTQPTQAIKFAIMAALLITAYTPTKIKWKNIGILVMTTLLLISIWWGPVITETLAGKSTIALRCNEQLAGSIADTSAVAQGIFSPTLGTATQAYTWEHYVFIADPNLINSPTGLGPIIIILAALGLFFSMFKLFGHKHSAEKPYLTTVLLWLTFTFLGMNSMTFNLPVGLFAFRFWMLFAIPISLLCAEGLHSLERFLTCRWNKILVVGLFIIAVMRISLPFKIWFNTSEWNYGVHWASDEDINGYVWMRKKLPVNTKVFSFTDNVLVLGHDMYADFWTDDYKKRFTDIFKKDIDALYQNLSETNYDCLIISPRDIRDYGREAVNKKIKVLHHDPRFRLIFNNEAVKIFQVLNVRHDS